MTEPTNDPELPKVVEDLVYEAASSQMANRFWKLAWAAYAAGAQAEREKAQAEIDKLNRQIDGMVELNQRNADEAMRIQGASKALVDGVIAVTKLDPWAAERDRLQADLARLESDFAVAMQAANVSEAQLREQVARGRGLADALQAELDEVRRELAGCREMLGAVR